MPDDLLDLSDTSSSKPKDSSHNSDDQNPPPLDDPDVYCSVASGDFDDSESLKAQLSVVESELKQQVERNASLAKSLEEAFSKQKQMQVDFDTEKSQLMRICDSLRVEVEDLRARKAESVSSEPVITSQDVEAAKKQFEAKLKDVMEKAREHAKKIAIERDEFRKQAEEKEAKLMQFKQLMNEAKGSIESKDIEIREFQTEIDRWRSKCENLNLQLSNMESHYTTPPDLTDSSILLRVLDDEGTEWVLIESPMEKSWWRRTVFGNTELIIQIESVPVLSQEEITKLKYLVDTTKSELTNKCSEFDEYKKRAESLLERSRTALSETPSSAATPPDMESVRKLMKAEEEVTRLSSSVAKLNKRISQLETVEKNLRAELDEKNLVIEKEKEGKDVVCRRMKEIEIEKQKFGSSLDEKEKMIAELRGKIRDMNSERAVESLVVVEKFSPQSSSSPKGSVMNTSTPPSASLSKPSVVVTNMATQTIEQPISANVSTNFQSSTSYHDSVVIPLRNQIRTLIEDLESEKHTHELTKQQLVSVKEALRKVESDRTFASDLTDTTKIDYMRNVGRKFFSLVPHNVSEELEQILPVMLSLFQLSPDEIGRLLTDRRRSQPDQTSLINSFSLPKLW